MIIAEFGNEVLDAIGIESTSSVHISDIKLIDLNWFIAMASSRIIYSQLGIESPIAPDVTVLRKLEEHVQFGSTEDTDYVNLLKLKKLNIDVLILSNYEHVGRLLQLVNHFGHGFICKNIIICDADGVKYRGKYMIHDTHDRAKGESIRILRMVMNMVIADYLYETKR